LPVAVAKAVGPTSRLVCLFDLEDLSRKSAQTVRMSTPAAIIIPGSMLAPPGPPAPSIPIPGAPDSPVVAAWVRMNWLST